MSADLRPRHCAAEAAAQPWRRAPRLPTRRVLRRGAAGRQLRQIRRCRSAAAGSVSLATLALIYPRETPAPLLVVRVGSVAQSVAKEVEGQHGYDDAGDGQHEPRVERYDVDVLGVVEQHTPTGHRRPQSQAKE